MKIDHLGVAVLDLKEGIQQWTSIFGYQQRTEPVINTRQKVRVVFLTKDDSLTIKLIAPTDEESPIYRFAKRGGGLHHICFIVDDLNSSINKLLGKGLRLLTPPQPGEAFSNNSIAFMSAKNGLNIELIDTYERAMEITDHGSI